MHVLFDAVENLVHLLRSLHEHSTHRAFSIPASQCKIEVAGAMDRSEVQRSVVCEQQRNDSEPSPDSSAGARLKLNGYLLAHRLLKRGQQRSSFGNEPVAVRHPLVHHLAHMWVHARMRIPNTRARIDRCIDASTRTHLTRARAHTAMKRTGPNLNVGNLEGKHGNRGGG